MSKSTDPEDIALFGALTGVKIDASIEICKGLEIQPIYTHIMAPYMAAFAKPKQHAWHPAPWVAVSGGLGFDAHAQISLDAQQNPTSFSRVNTIWWVVALIRLRHWAPVRIPIVSNTSLTKAATAIVEPKFWPIEMSPTQIHFPSECELSEHDILCWVKNVFISSSILMEDAGFNMAFTSLDNSRNAPSKEVALVLIWTALEALIRPGKLNITKNLAIGISTYLESNISLRNALFDQVKNLYEARGNTIHSGTPADPETVMKSYKLACRCFTSVIETNRLPDFGALTEAWKTQVHF